MSIEEKSPTVPTEESPLIDNSRPRPKPWYRFLLSPLWICLLVALVLRVWLIVHTHGFIDGDEALVGIQAEHILNGDFPIYFYGIPYFGSLEAYLASILFAIFGPSSWALRAQSTIVSLVLVALTWRLASMLADAARLPPYAKRIFTLVAGLTAAVPPLYDGLVELRTWGGYIETFVLMLLLLLSVFRLTQRWHERASNRELLWRWAGIGFIVGLGMWVYPLIISAIIVSALWIVIDRVVELMRVRRELAGGKERTATAIQRSIRPVLFIWSAIPASIVGCFPAIIWGASNHWENIKYIRQLSGTWSIQRIHTIHRVINMYVSCVAPRLISGAQPLESKTAAVLHAPLLIFTVACIFATTALVVLSFFWHHPTLLLIRRLAGLPTLFGACAAIIYCIGSASIYSLISCGLDLAGRYATPLMLTFPFFIATIFTVAGMYIYEKRRDLVYSAHNDSSPGEQVQARAYSLSDPYARLLSIAALVVAFATLFAYLGAQAWTYGLSYADYDFQSPYCSLIPPNDDPIITYMQQQHIRYAWATNLLAHPIIFRTNSAIIVVDPLELTHPPMAINRIPAYSARVYQADRPSFIVFVQHVDPHPLLLRLLDADRVTYRVARFYSQPGIDVIVATPLNRTISPVQWRYLRAFNCFTT